MPDQQVISSDLHQFAAHVIVVLATLFASGIAVIVHYEGLSAVSTRLARKGGAHRRRKVLFAICVILSLHIVEIWIFGLVCWLLLFWPTCGYIAGANPISLENAVYLSATTFSTLGFGDLTPKGAIRYLIGTESLVGLVLITWSASYTYLEMQQFWNKHHGHGEQ